MDYYMFLVPFHILTNPQYNGSINISSKPFTLANQKVIKWELFNDVMHAINDISLGVKFSYY
jgi:hypothetical protein